MTEIENGERIPRKIDSSASCKIQVLRGLSIAAVVLAHTTPWGLKVAFLRPFFNLSVVLFVFFSGMLTSADRWNPKKRITKVLIPYVLWTLIYTLLDNNESVSEFLSTLLNNLLLGYAAAVMYYIFVYCELTLLVPLIDRLARSKYRYWWLLISPIEILLVHELPFIMGIQFDPLLRRLISLSFVPWFSYYYLGYLIGNGWLTVRTSTIKLIALFGISVILQIMEGSWYYYQGNVNCGTPYKMTSIPTAMIAAVLSSRFVYSDITLRAGLFKLLGDYSFWIFFSHLAIIQILKKIPDYRVVPFPFNSFIVILVSLLLGMIIKRILGKHAKYLAL